MSNSQFIRKNFNKIWPVHLTAFTKLLTQLRQSFDGDLDLMLVLAIIGSRTRPETWQSELVSAHDMTAGEKGTMRQYPINIQSVSDFSGIPRETVRRKVRILQDKGWVIRDSDGRLSVTGLAAKGLANETEDTIAYLGALRHAFDDKGDCN
jgi:predicted transcriptional regulator